MEPSLLEPRILALLLSLGPAAAAPRPPGPPVALTNLTLIDGTGAPARPGMTVVISEGRIASVGRREAIQAPAGALTIDATGKFLVPGLWDMHVHLAKAGEPALALLLANGVTSVRDMGGDFAQVLRWRDEVASGSRLGPRILTAGPILESARHVEGMIAGKTVEPVERTRRAVATVADADRVVTEVAALGVDFVKIRTAQSPETYRAIVEAARRRGLDVAAHAAVGLDAMIEAGQRSLEHPLIPPLSGKSDAERAALFQAMAGRGMAVVPTLVTGEKSLLVPAEEAARIVDDRAGRIDPRRRYLSGYLIEDWREQLGERDAATAAAVRSMVPAVLRDLVEMRRAGVRLMPGTDLAVLLIYPGFTLHDELGLMVERLGMTPMEALVAATRTPAEFLGLQERLGTIAPGQAADLLLLDANPLEEIANTRRIDTVVAGGRVLRRADLDRMLEEVARRAAAEERR